jgi:hypothetical protein
MTSTTPLHQLTQAVIGSAVLGCIIVLMFLGALHSPEPNDVKLAIVGPEKVTVAVGESIEAAAPGAFDIEYRQDVEAAREDVKSQDLIAAFVPGKSDSQLYLAGANGALSKGALTEVFGKAAESSGTNLVVEDLVPLPAGDPAGLSPFLLTIATMLPSLVLAGLIGLRAGSQVSGSAKLLAVLVGSGCLALINALVVDPIHGALEGNFWGVFGAAWLLAVAVAGIALALHRLIGIAGIGIAALFLIIVGMPVAGAAIGPSFIPEGFQALTLTLPVGEAVPLIRKIVYFDGASLGLELSLLCGWAALAALMLLTPGRRGGDTTTDSKSGASYAH